MKKIAAILICAAIVLTGAISVAYYNTKTFGFDENAEIVSKDNEKISFLDYNIYYKDIDYFFSEAAKIFPEKQRLISPSIHHNVVNI